ncbi:hypothetical protein FGG08_006796 [Glutinoglossum americanum]|uniref:Thioesterase-like superfamily-domain-containing protein n=1 Tax=Glutinoglossum americanum TaxID=1670608 RepID=A0A9P8HXK5_9PEZI|nr:hypothetical protein FGG08_006796 [Glutinoglossum americanum]
MSYPIYPKTTEAGRSTSFAEATAVEQVDSHTYSAFFPSDWSIGTVPHGGFVTSVFLQTASKHFATTLRSQNQPHTIALHIDFLRRTQAGPAKFVVADVKLGRQTSVIHITLTQNNQNEVVAYLTNSNIDTEVGPSLDTEYSLHPPPVPADLAKLRDDTDPNWSRVHKTSGANFRKAYTKVTPWLPRQGQHHQSMADEWVAFSTGERFTNESLGFICDMWPAPVDFFRSSNAAHIKDRRPPKTVLSENSVHWYPTLVLNLDIKKALPAEGVEFLFVRARTKGVRNGRFDMEVVIMDESGEIVALSHHVCLVLGVERNVADRSGVKL